MLVLLLLQVLGIRPGRSPAAAPPAARAPSSRLVVVDDGENHDVQEQQGTPDAYGHGQGERERRVARAAAVRSANRRGPVILAVRLTAVVPVAVLGLSVTVVVVAVASVRRRGRRHNDRRRLQYVRAVLPPAV